MNEQQDFDFLDLVTILGLGLQFQSFIESRNQPLNSDIVAKLEHIINLLETSEPRSTKSIENADKRP